MTAEQMEQVSAGEKRNKFYQVGNRRYDIGITMSAPFSDPVLFANDVIGAILRPLLDEGYLLNSFTVVVSHPGAGMQHIHRDHWHLFEADVSSRFLPPHAINVAIPLIDVDVECGPTGVWPGSHRWPTDAPCPPSDMVTATLSRGDCMLMDYRTMHAGLPNRSTRVRPIIYLVYARPWFFDENNYGNRVPIDLPAKEYGKLPAPAQKLMARALRWQVLRAGT
jgi:ectoine hydroxylase-related dioxygenase (phytanoyl-CoA dioxygenase family)